MSEQERCGNCRFFCFGEPEPDILYGQCRRYPPVLDREAEYEVDAWRYPHVSENQDCGEWKPANPATKEA